MSLIDYIVAAGYVEETNSLTLHGIPLGELNYCVVVEIAFEDIGTSLVGHVIGSVVVWPKYLSYLMI